MDTNSSYINDPRSWAKSLLNKDKMSYAEFEAEAMKHGFRVRVVSINGQDQAGTCDFQLDRINVSVVGANETISEKTYVLDGNVEKYVNKSFKITPETYVSEVVGLG
jgi:hypothetical protein